MSGNASKPRGIVLVLGGGVAGLAATRALTDKGVQVKLVERAHRLGGRVEEASSVFPSMAKGHDVIEELKRGSEGNGLVEMLMGAELSFVRSEDRGFEAEVQLGSKGEKDACLQRMAVHADAIIIATGLEPVDASIIPELGYPRLRNVVLSTTFDRLLTQASLLRPSDGGKVSAVAFVQCVGSRVERRGVPYCSAVCCMNAIKSAIAVKEMDNAIDAFVLYIDVRTHGKGYEALYKKARERGVKFIRGQPSMVLRIPRSERLHVMGENTLLKELYEIPVDLVVLSIGLRQRQDNLELFNMLDLRLDNDGLVGEGTGLGSVHTSVPGVFVAGCAEAPKDVRDSIAQGEAAAMAALSFISKEV